MIFPDSIDKQSSKSQRSRQHIFVVIKDGIVSRQHPIHVVLLRRRDLLVPLDFTLACTPCHGKKTCARLVEFGGARAHTFASR